MNASSKRQATSAVKSCHTGVASKNWNCQGENLPFDLLALLLKKRVQTEVRKQIEWVKSLIFQQLRQVFICVLRVDVARRWAMLGHRLSTTTTTPAWCRDFKLWGAPHRRGAAAGAASNNFDTQLALTEAFKTIRLRLSQVASKITLLPGVKT